MKGTLYIWTVCILGQLAPVSAWHAYSAFVLGRCDTKFGCVGGFQFAVLIYGISSVVSSFGIAGAYALLARKLSLKFNVFTSLSALATALAFLVFTRSFIQQAASSISSMLILWLILSFVVSLVVFYVPKRI